MCARLPQHFVPTTGKCLAPVPHGRLPVRPLSSGDPTLATLRDIHATWAWVVIIGNGLAGLWALGAAKLPPLRTRALWWFTFFVELAVFVQVGLGVGLVAGQKVKAPKFHMFYGFVAIVAVGIIYSYRQQLADKLYWLYGGGGLFVMGLGIRAMLVAKAP